MENLSIFLALAFLYAGVSVLKPLPPFKHRGFAAGAAVLLLFAGVTANETYERQLQEKDPEAYAALVAEREASKAKKAAEPEASKAKKAAERERKADEPNCEAQGIDAEREFARRVCAAAEDLGLHPTLVHSFGAGGVDVFVSESEEVDLRTDPTKLRRLMVKLTDWVKQNYVGFNAVDVTLVGDSKIAKGSKVGTMEMKVILF